MHSKAQAWFTDFTIAILLFIVLLIIYFTYTLNLSKRNIETFNNLVSDANSISSSLVLEGYPANWTSANVQRLGLTDNSQRIVQDKLIRFYNLSYYNRKTLFNTQFDYFIFLKNKDNCLINASGFFGAGHSDVAVKSVAECSGFSENSVNLSTISPKNIIRTDRLLILNSNIVDLVIYLWQK